MAVPELNLNCPKCLHRHRDIRFAFICIGCPCTWTPPAPESPRAIRELAELDLKRFGPLVHRKAEDRKGSR
jgi:hypothetical protein